MFAFNINSNGTEIAETAKRLELYGSSMLSLSHEKDKAIQALVFQFYSIFVFFLKKRLLLNRI